MAYDTDSLGLGHLQHQKLLSVNGTVALEHCVDGEAFQLTGVALREEQGQVVIFLWQHQRQQSEGTKKQAKV